MRWKNRITDGEDYINVTVIGLITWLLAAMVLLCIIAAAMGPGTSPITTSHGDIALVVSPVSDDDEVPIGSILGATWYFAIPGIVFGYCWAPASTMARKQTKQQCARAVLLDTYQHPHNTNMPIVAVIVDGGVADVVDSGNARICVIDLDNLRESGETVELPRGQGYEELLDGLGLDRYITYIDAGVAK